MISFKEWKEKKEEVEEEKEEKEDKEVEEKPEGKGKKKFLFGKKDEKCKKGDKKCNCK